MCPDKSALPFKRLESVGRETLSAFAAADTERPRGSITSVLMNVPGCGGLSMRMDVVSLFIRLLIHLLYLRHYSLSTVIINHKHSSMFWITVFCLSLIGDRAIRRAYGGGHCLGNCDGARDPSLEFAVGSGHEAASVVEM